MRTSVPAGASGMDVEGGASVDVGDAAVPEDPDAALPDAEPDPASGERGTRHDTEAWASW